MYHTIKKSEI